MITTRRIAPRAAVGVVYVGSVVAANWLTSRYGLVPVGFGLMVTSGTFAAGCALLARNIGQDVTGRVSILGLMALGVALSWWLASPALALASAVAFGLSELADMAVYTRLYAELRARRPRALVCAAAVGALLDTVTFLHLAGFPLTRDAVLGQLLVKIGISTVVALALEVARRAVLREPFNREGA